MPTYEYECKKCGALEEHFHGYNESPDIRCEKCGYPMQRLISAGAGLIFKGSGFYVTDYKKSGEKPGGKKRKGITSGSSTSKDSKDSKKKTTATESKTDTKKA